MILSEEVIAKLNKLITIYYLQSAIRVLENFTLHRIHLAFAKDLLGVTLKKDFDYLIRMEPFKVYTCLVQNRKYFSRIELLEILKAYHEHLTTEAYMG